MIKETIDRILNFGDSNKLLKYMKNKKSGGKEFEQSN